MNSNWLSLAAALVASDFITSGGSHETPRHLLGPDPNDPKEQARVEERIRKAKERRENRAMTKARNYEKATRKTSPK